MEPHIITENVVLPTNKKITGIPRSLHDTGAPIKMPKMSSFTTSATVMYLLFFSALNERLSKNYLGNIFLTAAESKNSCH